jgi:hypothetical protein
MEGLPDHDYWLFDSRKLVRMHFDDEDRFLGGECAHERQRVKGLLCRPGGAAGGRTGAAGPAAILRTATGLLSRKVDSLSCERFASARYWVPTELLGTRIGVRTDEGRLLVIVNDGHGCAETGHHSGAHGRAR